MPPPWVTTLGGRPVGPPPISLMFAGKLDWSPPRTSKPSMPARKADPYWLVVAAKTETTGPS